MVVNDSESGYAAVPDNPNISFWLELLNSFFGKAKIAVRISELTSRKEQVVIGFPQIESLESELTLVKTEEDFTPTARYLATATIKSQGHKIPTLIRFYLTSDGKLTVEDSTDDGASLVSIEEAKSPELQEKVVPIIIAALPWLEFAVKLVLSALGIISDE